VKEGHTSTDRWHATIAPRGKFALPALPSGALLLRMADGSRLITVE
jgi:hypothetical protein